MEISESKMHKKYLVGKLQDKVFGLFLVVKNKVQPGDLSQKEAKVLSALAEVLTEVVIKEWKEMYELAKEISDIEGEEKRKAERKETR